MEEKDTWRKEFGKQTILDRLHLSVNEISELGIGWLLMCGILLYLMYRNGLLEWGLGINSLLESVILYFFVLGISFFTHELMHKFTAIRFGAKASYHISREGLFFTLISVFIGFPILTIGAVYWWGEAAYSTRLRGRVSAAGPISNLILIGFSYILMGFSVVMLSISPDLSLFLFQIGSMSVSLNVFLGLFNLLPIGVLDGAKVLDWDGRIWLALVGSFLVIGIFSGGFGLFLPT